MKGIIALSTLMALVISVPAFAQNAQLEGTVNAGAGTERNGSVIDAEVNVETQVGTGGQVKESENEDESSTTSAEAQGTTSIDAGAEVNSVSGSVISVRAMDVRGWDSQEKQEFLTTAKTHTQVRSGQDLENFATAVLLRDENVEEISSDDEEIEVRYQVPAKLLGLFTTTIPATVIVAKAEGESVAEGRIHVRFPWLRFLYTVPDVVQESSLESELQAQLSAELANEPVINTREEARIYQAVTTVMRAKHDLALNSLEDSE